MNRKLNYELIDGLLMCPECGINILNTDLHNLFHDTLRVLERDVKEIRNDFRSHR